MNSLQGLLYGLQIAATPANLLAAFAGAFAGTAIGVLPGLGPVAGVALILPLTFSLDPTAGLIMMAGIFYGSMYGGSTTAILLNIPGESASVVTAIDGYQLAKKGRAGATLTIVAVGSFVGGTLAVVGVMMFSSSLANLAILFGPAEFFALTAGGLIVMSRISGGTLASALLPMTLGLMLGTDRPGGRHRRDPLHVRSAGPRRGRVAGACRGRALWLRRADAAGRGQGACRQPAGVR